MAITIKEIAQLAGVSRGTVDRVLNNRGQVSQEIKEKVLKIAADFDYKKNVIASQLARKESITIAIVLPDYKTDKFWEAPLAGIMEMHESISDYGFKIKMFLFDIFDKCSYATAFERAIKNKPNAILVAPVFHKETMAFLKITQHNNIPVVCINSEINHEDAQCFIGQDSYQSGVIAARLFDFQYSDSKKIVALTLGHDSKNATHIESKIGGLKAYKRRDNSSFEIIDYVINDFGSPVMLQRFAKDLIKNHPDIRGVFFTNSRAYHFLKSTALDQLYTHRPMCIGFDLIKENIYYLNEGRIDFLLNQNPENQGYLGIEYLFNLFIHKKQLPQKQYLPIDIIIKENISRYIDKNAESLENNYLNRKVLDDDMNSYSISS